MSRKVISMTEASGLLHNTREGIKKLIAEKALDYVISNGGWKVFEDEVLKLKEKEVDDFVKKGPVKLVPKRKQKLVHVAASRKKDALCTYPECFKPAVWILKIDDSVKESMPFHEACVDHYSDVYKQKEGEAVEILEGKSNVTSIRNRQ